MKSLKIISIYLFLNCTLLAQEIKYVPIVLSGCDSLTKVKNEIRFLTDSAINNIYFDSKEKIYPEGFYKLVDDTFTLTKPGLYRLYGKNLVESIFVQIKDMPIQNDTFYNSKLQEYNKKYYYCEDLAHGNLKGTFLDGRTKETGSFKRGKVKDTLIQYYYSNGTVRRLLVNKSFGYKNYFYDVHGNLQRWDSCVYLKNIFTKYVSFYKSQLETTYQLLKIGKKWYRQKKIFHNDSLHYVEIFDKKRKDFYRNEIVFKSKRKRSNVLSFYYGDKSEECNTYQYTGVLYNKKGNKIMKAKIYTISNPDYGYPSKLLPFYNFPRLYGDCITLREWFDMEKLSPVSFYLYHRDKPTFKYIRKRGRLEVDNYGWNFIELRKKLFWFKKTGVELQTKEMQKVESKYLKKTFYYKLGLPSY